MQNELGRIVDALPGLVWTALPDGRIDFVNQRWCEFSGLAMDDARGDGWQATVHPDDLHGLLDHWKSILSGSQPGEMEARLRRFDGQYRSFVLRVRPLLGATGKVDKWCGINSEIQGGGRADTLIADEKRLLEMAVSDFSLRAILETFCRSVERALAGSRCSIALNDLSGAHLKHVASPSLPADFIAAIEVRPVHADWGPCAMAAFLNEQVIAADFGSEKRWAHVWCPMAMRHGLQACWSTPVVSTTGKVLGVFALYFDEPREPGNQHRALLDRFTRFAAIVIERTQSYDELKRGRAFLSEVQRLTSTGGFSWHLATDELTWSEEVYRIFELDPSLTPTLALTLTRLHPEDVPAFQEMRLRQLADGEDFEFDYRLLMPDQSVKYLHIVCHATRDQDGLPVYRSAVQDITARRLAEEALAKARSELAHVSRVTTLGALTASIAHEVNQPLSGIITNANTCLRMLASDPPNIEGARETARRTIRDGNRASDVITRLRALYSKTAGATESVDLNDAALEVIALSRSELQRGRIILRTELADDLPAVMGDRIQLQQVILNLLINAADAMDGVDDRPRELTIRTEADQVDNVQVSVQDSGIGIDPQATEKVFEAFYTTKSNGMGIGLSVSRSIIESHQGRLWAVPNDKPGATFSFSIPRQSRRTGARRSDDGSQHGRPG